MFRCRLFGHKYIGLRDIGRYRQSRQIDFCARCGVPAPWVSAAGKEEKDSHDV